MPLKLTSQIGTSQGITRSLFIVIAGIHVMASGKISIEVHTYQNQAAYEENKECYAIVDNIPSVIDLPGVGLQDLNGLPDFLQFFENQLKAKLEEKYGVGSIENIILT